MSLKMTDEKKTYILEQLPSEAHGQRMMDRISPIYDRSIYTRAIFDAVGAKIAEMFMHMVSFMQETKADSTVLLILYWEEKYGLRKNEAISLLERRNRIMSASIKKAPMNPSKLASLIQALVSRAVWIEDPSAPYTFRIWIESNPNEVSNERVMALVSEMKPAHLAYSIAYEQYVSGTEYWGGVFVKYQNITIGQVN